MFMTICSSAASDLLLFSASKTGKQTTLQFKPVKKEKKKNPWSSDEEGSAGEESDMSTSPSDAAPRERLGRKANGENE